jgi:hypothetical protein
MGTSFMHEEEESVTRELTEARARTHAHTHTCFRKREKVDRKK